MILFRFMVRKKRESDYKVSFSVCAVCTAFVCRLCNWLLSVILYPAVKQDLAAEPLLISNVFVEGIDVADGVGNLGDITRFQRVTGRR